MFVFTISEANGHHETIALIIQAKLGLAVALLTLPDEMLVYIHTKRRKGHRLVIPSK